MPSVEVIDHRSLGRIDEVSAVSAMKVAILAERGGVPIYRLRKLLHLNGFRQTFAATDNHLCRAAGGLRHAVGSRTFGSGLDVLAHHIAVLVGKGDLRLRAC